MAYNYAQEKFWKAMNTLVGDGSIQRRLAWAAVELSLLDGRDEELAENIRDEFKAVLRELTKESPVGNEGTIEATTSRLKSEDVVKVASRILSTYKKLHGRN
ncbi:MAG TPA: hypothetical protein VI455_11960 [Terriglobia bacterium]